jgi:hypothetical protein
VADSDIDDGSIADLPWGTVFDPVVNARAMSAIQQRGFRAAREVVDRLIKMADSDFVIRSSESESTAAQPDSDDSEPAPTISLDVDGVLGSMQGLLGQLAATLRGTLGGAPASDPAMFDLRAASSSGQIEMITNQPGAVSAEIWLHNGRHDDMGKVRLRCSDLLAHDGGLIEAACVRFEPDTVPMPARSSRGVTVEVDVAEDQEAGTYRGTMLADGHAEVWLPVVLVIRSDVE